MQIIHSKAAGIDLGSCKVFVSIAGQSVRSFDSFTENLIELVKYLQEHEIRTVAMEATGVYWIILYDLIEAAGIEVLVVNAAHMKSVPGRKSDVQDCQWIQQLHSCGLLRASFVPPGTIRALRAYRRLREDHITIGADHIRHMQKALDMMNIKLHTVISQIHGVSGLRIIDAVLAGERDAKKLTELCETQILKSKRREVLASLRGHWKAEQLFALKQARAAYEFYQTQIKECDKQIDQLLQELGQDKPPQDPNLPDRAKPIRHHDLEIEKLHPKLMKITEGKNPTVLPGVTDLTMIHLISEVGLDMKRWATCNHFTSWLGLAPSMHQSGKMKRRKRGRKKTQAGQIFRLIAQSVGQSKNLALGGFYRRIKARSGAMIANVATARKIAVLYYNLMCHGLEYVEQGLKEYEKTYQDKIIRNLKKKAQVFGFQLTPLSPT